jgi:hypothetical protein
MAHTPELLVLSVDKQAHRRHQQLAIRPNNQLRSINQTIKNPRDRANGPGA